MKFSFSIRTETEGPRSRFINIKRHSFILYAKVRLRAKERSETLPRVAVRSNCKREARPVYTLVTRGTVTRCWVQASSCSARTILRAAILPIAAWVTRRIPIPASVPLPPEHEHEFRFSIGPRVGCANDILSPAFVFRGAHRPVDLIC